MAFWGSPGRFLRGQQTRGLDSGMVAVGDWRKGAKAGEGETFWVLIEGSVPAGLLKALGGKGVTCQGAKWQEGTSLRCRNCSSVMVNNICKQAGCITAGLPAPELQKNV